MLKLTFTEDAEKIVNREKCLNWFRKYKVNVGLKSSASGRSKFLLRIHTYDSPDIWIPPRSVVVLAPVQEILRAEMGEKLVASCKAAF